MQTKMFVFLGVPSSKTYPTIEGLQERLKLEFSNTGKSLQFVRKEQLLTSRHNDVSFYVSILESKKQLKDWAKMAKDFKLSSDLTSLTETSIEVRYDKLKKEQPSLYSDAEYAIATTIFGAMQKIATLEIISFQ